MTVARVQKCVNCGCWERFNDSAEAFVKGWRKMPMRGGYEDYCPECEDVRREKVDEMRRARGLKPLYKKSLWQRFKEGIS